MGFKRIIKVHIYCELFNFCMCLHNCYCAVVYNSARDLPVSTVSLEAYALMFSFFLTDWIESKATRYARNMQFKEYLGTCGCFVFSYAGGCILTEILLPKKMLLFCPAK